MTGAQSEPSPDGVTDLGLLGHELRTPLTALLGFADAMRAQAFGPLPAPYDTHAQTIYAAARHLLALVDDMTDTARAEAGVWSFQPRRFDPRGLATEVVELFNPAASAKGVSLELRGAGEIGDIVADRRAVGQILINLLDNALKFSRPGGQVAITLRRTDANLLMVVSDIMTGDDLPASTMLPPRGQGVGLRLARALCALHKGSLTLEIRPGEGATATVHLAVFPEA